MGTGLVSHQILYGETWVVGRGDRFSVPPKFANPYFRKHTFQIVTPIYNFPCSIRAVRFTFKGWKVRFRPSRAGFGTKNEVPRVEIKKTAGDISLQTVSVKRPMLKAQAAGRFLINKPTRGPRLYSLINFKIGSTCSMPMPGKIIHTSVCMR